MKKFWHIWGLSLIIKLIISALLPLSADEAYYWVWAQRPQLSYFDHPPMISWLFYLGHFLEPFLNSVRWPAVLLGHLIIAIWFSILKDSISFEKFRVWIWLALLSPLVGFGSIILTPDLPVLFFWSLSLSLMLKALKEEHWYYYAAFGASLGLGFCSKYHIVLFIPCLFLYLFFSKKWHQVSWRGVFFTALLGLICSLPVVIWNFQNNFASFEFQLKHGLEKSTYNIEWTTSYLIGQVLLVFPLMFWAALKAKVPRDLSWLYFFGWGPLLFFFATSFRASTEANWPIIGHPAILALALFHPKVQSWLKYYIAFWGLLMTIVLGSILVPSFRTIHEKLEEPYLFQEMSPLVSEYSPLYADSYQLAASLWYFTKTPIYKLKEMSRFDFFDSFSQAVPQGNRFYLITKKGNSLPAWFSEQQWQMKEVKSTSKNYVLLEFTRP